MKLSSENTLETLQRANRAVELFVSVAARYEA